MTWTGSQFVMNGNQGSILFTTEGLQSWTPPPNVTSINVSVLGGAGGGGGGSLSYAGGRGGNGGYSSQSEAVGSGDSISILIGSGGIGGATGASPASDNYGTPSTVSDLGSNWSVEAQGGGAGQPALSDMGGNAGSDGTGFNSVIIPPEMLTSNGNGGAAGQADSTNGGNGASGAVLITYTFNNE